jgi:CDP-glucose 4,6-dehydratase
MREAYRGKRVFLTGHTGFKGGWLALWLSELGAEVTGFSLPPDTDPSFFALAGVGEHCRHLEGDIRRPDALARALSEARPDYVFHLAAQALVRRSYDKPIETLETNVMGTAHLLEAIRQEHLRCAVVIVTSDKCYENREWVYGYREHEPMGGHDVYSMSKGATELVVSSFRRSFFPPAELARHGVALATARAGNVIGGGDWAPDRLVPDIARALAAKRPVPVRNPGSVRPWQHVLEPLGGYLLLGARLAGIGADRRETFCDAWNFGPLPDATVTVRHLVERMIHHWGQGSWEDRSDPAAPHEAGLLSLSIEKAQRVLGWKPRWSFDEAIRHTARWYQEAPRAASPREVRAMTQAQLEAYRLAGAGA